jgi:hypothetical protein
MRSPSAKLMKFIRATILAVMLPTGIFAQYSSSGTIFEGVAPTLGQKTRVPLKLPSYLATEAETNPLHVIVMTVAPGRYELQLAFTQNCTGGTSCRYGMISGQTVRRGMKRPRGKPVRLLHGITGYFIDAKCGANCSDSTLTWQQAGYRYVVGIKAANLRTLRKVANSAINNRVVAS